MAEGLLKAWALKDPLPQIFKCLPMFQMAFLNVDVSVIPLMSSFYSCSASVDIVSIF